jgi:hypothetical protein
MSIHARIRRRKASDVKGFCIGGKESMNPESADAGVGCRPSLEDDTGMVALHVRGRADEAKGGEGVSKIVLCILSKEK